MDVSAALLLLPALLALFSFSDVAAGQSPPSSPASFRTVYAFGDSFTDTGNTHSTTGPFSFGYVSHPPYGTTFFHRSTNRYSDGRLVVDFLAADALRLPSFLPPYLSSSSAAANASSGNSLNFAVAGATAIEHEWFVKNNLSFDVTPHSIMTELGWFDEHLKTRRSKEDVGEALFWVGEIGANDYAYSLIMAADKIPRKVIRTLAIDRVTTFLEGLLKRGAKYIAVQGLPPAAHGLPDDGHGAGGGAAGRPGRPRLCRLRQRGEPGPQPPPPGQAPPAPAEAPRRRHRLRRLPRRPPRRRQEPCDVRLRGALQGLLRRGRGRLQLQDPLHLRLAGGWHRVRAAGQVCQLGRGAHDRGHVQGRRRHVLPGWLREVLPADVQLLAGQESPRQLN